MCVYISLNCLQANNIPHIFFRAGQRLYRKCALSGNKLSRMKNRTEQDNTKLAKIVLLLVKGVMIDDDGEQQTVSQSHSGVYKDDEDVTQDEEEENMSRDEQETDSEEEENSPTTQQSKRPKLTDGDLTQDYNPVEEDTNPPHGSVQVSPNYRKGETANDNDITEQQEAVSNESIQTTIISITKRRDTSPIEIKGEGDFVRRSVRNSAKGVTQEEVKKLYEDPEIQTLLAGSNEGNILPTMQPEDSEEEPLLVSVK